MRYLIIPFVALCISCSGSVVIESDDSPDTDPVTEDPCESFAVAKVTFAKPTNVDGTVYEGVRDIYVTYSGPAEGVGMDTFEDASGMQIGYYNYTEELTEPGQITFAMGVYDLKPLTTYNIKIYGHPADLPECWLIAWDTFTTDDF